MSERVAPMFCPYCAEENLRPHGETHGTWECRSCTRVFALKFVGLLAPAAPRPATGSVVDR